MSETELLMSILYCIFLDSKINSIPPEIMAKMADFEKSDKYAYAIQNLESNRKLLNDKMLLNLQIQIFIILRLILMDDGYKPLKQVDMPPEFQESNNIEFMQAFEYIQERKYLNKNVQAELKINSVLNLKKLVTVRYIINQYMTMLNPVLQNHDILTLLEVRLEQRLNEAIQRFKESDKEGPF